RRLAGPGRGEIVPRHRNGEVGPQAQVLAAGVGRQVKTLADVLAREVEERVGRLQDRGLGPDVAGLRERQQQRIRPSGGGGGNRSSGGGRSHFVSKVLSTVLEKLQGLGKTRFRGFDWRSP